MALDTPVNRRDFLRVSGCAAATATLASCTGTLRPSEVSGDKAHLTGYFLSIVRGFLRNAQATSPDYTVCDFPQGTRLGSCCNKHGKTFTSVARMLPALAEFVCANKSAEIDGADLREVLFSTFRTAFDPEHPDFWGEPIGSKPTQRTVESSLVAIALAKMGPEFIRNLSSRERANINRWLSSCTVVPERTNNHAWFTAVNQAARLKLGRSFPEFVGDEQWMIEDLKAMDILAANAADGWYSDDPKLTVYDYYNFWTFGNFPLFWSRIAGDLYPEWNAKLRSRAKEFLKNTPYFFAADGAVPLFGRSLLYRWSILSPLLLGYEQDLWPYSPGLLRRIIRRHFDWWWRLGAYDEQCGKLRETLSPDGTPDVSESYIDNGHPYWAMQGFTFLSIPATDPLWTQRDEKLPVETADFLVRIPGPKMLLAGTKSSGQVRWLQALNTPRRDYYRDKYNKFCWSSAFPFNVMQRDKKVAPWDQALVFRDPASGVCAWRVFPDSGELLEDGVRTAWATKLNDCTIHVTSAIRLSGEFEIREHQIKIELPTSGSNQASRLEVLEGSYPLGLAENEKPRETKEEGCLLILSKNSGHLLGAWTKQRDLRVVDRFAEGKPTNINLVHPNMAVIILSQVIDPVLSPNFTIRSVHYGSPRPLPLAQLRARASQLL